MRFNLAYNRQSWTWRSQDVDLQQLLVESIHQSADLIAATNTIAASDRGARLYELTVNGIGGPKDYYRCLSYLQGLSMVNRVAVTSARSGQVRFQIALNALPQYLEDTLVTGRVLEPGDTEGNYLLIP